MTKEALKRALGYATRSAMLMHTSEGREVVCIEPQLWKQLREAINQQAQQEPVAWPVACVHIKDGCFVGSHRDQSKPFPDGQYGLWPINTPPAAAQPAAMITAIPRNVRERWNIELDGDDLLVCFNDHEKGDKCEYKRYSPQPTFAGH